MRVYPNPERLVEGEPVKVRDLNRGDYLPTEGRRVPRNQYWLRRLRDGDVLEGMAPVNEDAAADVQADGAHVGEPVKLTKAQRKAAARAAREAAKFDTPEAAAAAAEANSDGDNAENMPHDAEKSPQSAEAPATADKSEG